MIRMVRWLTILNSALALTVSGLTASGQPADKSAAALPGPVHVVIVDSRIEPAEMDVVRNSLAELRTTDSDEAGSGPADIKIMSQSGGCGAPFQTIDPGSSSSGSSAGNNPQSNATPKAADGGRSSLFDLDSALRSALEQKRPENHLSVLLIAHGPSQCMSIGCALAALMAAQQGGTEINVIGLRPAAAALNCLARDTGGELKQVGLDKLPAAIKAVLEKTATPLSVANPQEATSADTSTAEGQPDGNAAATQAAASATTTAGGDALTATARNTNDYPPIPKPRPDLSVDEAGESTADQPEESFGKKPFQWAALPPGAPETDTSAEPTGPGVSLRVLAGPTGPLVETQLAFETLSPEGDGTYRRVAHSTLPNPFIALPKGQYVARVSHGEVIREFPFTVSGDGTDHHAFSLDLGYLSLQARASADAAPLESGIVYTVYRHDTETAGKALLVRQDSQPTIALSPGNYRVLAQSGSAKIVADLHIRAGEMRRHHFDFNFGYLRVEVLTDAQDVSL